MIILTATIIFILTTLNAQQNHPLREAQSLILKCQMLYKIYLPLALYPVSDRQMSRVIQKKHHNFNIVFTTLKLYCYLIYLNFLKFIRYLILSTKYELT